MTATHYYKTQRQPGPAKPLIVRDNTMTPPQWFVKLGRRTFNITDQLQRILSIAKAGGL